MNKTLEHIKQIIEESDKDIVIAIDGRCGAGKTTLANELSKEFNANLFHMDDYFLRPSQRTSQRYDEAGGNVDRERFLEEIGSQLHTNNKIIYTPFDCKTMNLKDSIIVQPNKITIVEGSYALHPDLRHLYDLTIFIDIDHDLQLERLKKRNPHNYDDFINKWIPYEEKYFNTFNIRECCGYVLHAEEMLKV